MRFFSIIPQIFFIPAILLLGKTAIAQSDKNISGIDQWNDAIGIRISLAEWNKMVADVLDQTNGADSSKRDTAFYIKYVRVVNTIESNAWFDKYAEVRNLFYKKVFVNAIFSLNAGPYKGGCFYNAKIDLFIGGVPHANSMFYITSLKE
ncbi:MULTISPECIES: hypothetical protein [Niastella]|uniref:Phosphate ABC transporter substrate-binding protein n=1 Tax=Niastella soli TaxID=2821487 RepID=A0ABS3YZM6_9BACT|nr:hypothetical protein [Niastella soli]MBO9203377.1 hypothetical protein [Niastella soli]